MSRPYEFDFNEDPICPYCRAVLGDAWEYNGGDEGSFDVECGDCERPFIVERHISVKYSTKPKEPTCP